MYDGSKVATVGWTSAGLATRTRPAPDRTAAPPTRAAAPAIPRPPAITSTWPYIPLWLSTGRFGSVGNVVTRSSAMRSSARGRCRGLCRGRRYAALGRRAGLSRTPRDQAGDVPAIEARVDVDHHHVRGAAVEHAEEGGQAAEAGPVADGGRHRDHRAIDEPADHAGEGPFHPGNHHD